MHTVKLNELDKLPIGRIAPNGERIGTYGFKPWRGKDERAIGAIRDKNRSMNHVQFVSEVLSYFLTEWCGQSLEDKKHSEKLLTLAGAWAADVYAAWFNLRRVALGDDLDMQLVCPLCTHKFKYTIDVGTIDMKILDDGDSLQYEHVLRDGIEWKNKEHKKMTLSPLKWGAYEQMGNEGLNLGAIKLNLIHSAIVGLDGVDGPVMLPKAITDELTKYDLEKLTAHINDLQVGPDLQILLNCPRCTGEISRSVPWLYDDFFSGTVSSNG